MDEPAVVEQEMTLYDHQCSEEGCKKDTAVNHDLVKKKPLVSLQQ